MQTISNRLNRRQMELGSARNEDKKVSISLKHRSLSPVSPTLPRKSVEHNKQPSSEVKSPLQLVADVDKYHKEELDNLLQKLQQENSELKQAVDRKRRLGSTPNLESGRVPMRQTANSE